MAGKMTKERIQLKYKPGLNEIYDGDKYYRFFQKDYYEDFICYFASSGSAQKTYERIAGVFINDEEGKDHSRTISRYHDLILFGDVVNSVDMGRKLVDMLIALQENPEFNSKHHTYIEEIGTHKEKKFSYKWDDRQTKWKDIAEYDNGKKNTIIAGYIYELLNIMTESDFYNLKIIDQTDAENGYYDARIKEIYSMIDELYIDNQELNEKWILIMNPIKDMIHRHEFPGVYAPVWINANEAITYFDVAYDIAVSNPELFARVNNGGIAGVRFSIDINQEMINRREKYMRDKKIEDELGNAHRSELQLLEEEMKTALKMIMSNEFGTL